MSTRGCIARLQKRDPLEFKGVYHHCDSYPSGLGQTLFRLRNQEFRGDTAAMLKVLIDQHPAGWSSVVGADFTLKPGFKNWDLDGKGTETDARPQCYCHGDRHEADQAVTEKEADEVGVEYAYLFDGSKMLIAEPVYDDGSMMLGMFGCGDADAVWSVIAEIDLDGPEPDWEALNRAA